MAVSDPLDLNPEMLAAAAESKAWPFEEAKKIVARYAKTGFPETVLFETGYGPSGLPHIGTFGEVARTTMVRHAFRILTQDKVTTRLLVLLGRSGRHAQDSGQRAGPRRARTLSAHAADLGARIRSAATTKVSGITTTRCCAGSSTRSASTTNSPAPRTITSRAASTRCCCAPLPGIDDIMDVMLPTLGPERQATYSPFLPISPKSGRVLYVPMKHVDAKAGTITFDDERHRNDAAGHRRQRETAMEARFRHALGSARRRFRDVRQGSPDECRDLRQDLRRSSVGGRRSISSTNCSSTTRARRFPSRRATA